MPLWSFARARKTPPGAGRGAGRWPGVRDPGDVSAEHYP